MNYVSLSLGTLVSKALLELQSPAEQGLQVAITPSTWTTSLVFTMSSGSASVSDVIEIGSELLLITGKTSDLNPIYTAQRGYYQTVQNSTYTAGQLATVNPQWPRVRIAEGVKRSLSRLEALGVPLLKSGVFSKETDKRYVLMPAETREVVQVVGVADATGVIYEIPNWRLFQDLPTSVFSTGKAVRLPWTVTNTDSLQITYRAPYRWSSYPTDPTESATVTLPEGAEDLPALYASAWAVSSREISRGEIDRAEEWNRAEPQRGGVSLSLSKMLWQNFYRSLDEVRRLSPLPVNRPYVKMSRGA